MSISLLMMNVCCGAMRDVDVVKSVHAIPDNSQAAVDGWQRAQHGRRLSGSGHIHIQLLDGKRKACENVLRKICRLIASAKDQSENEKIRLNIVLGIDFVRNVVLYNTLIDYVLLKYQSKHALSIYKITQKQTHHADKTPAHQIFDAIMQYLERRQRDILPEDQVRMESLLNDLRDTFAEMHNIRYTGSTDIDLNKYVDDDVSCFEMLRRMMMCN